MEGRKIVKWCSYCKKPIKTKTYIYCPYCTRKLKDEEEYKKYKAMKELDRVHFADADCVLRNDVIQVICNVEPCEVVAKDEYDKVIKHCELLEARLSHLLLSDFIRSFDEVIPLGKNKGKYKRDIRETDKIAGLILGEYKLDLNGESDYDHEQITAWLQSEHKKNVYLRYEDINDFIVKLAKTGEIPISCAQKITDELPFFKTKEIDE